MVKTGCFLLNSHIYREREKKTLFQEHRIAKNENSIYPLLNTISASKLLDMCFVGGWWI